MLIVDVKLKKDKVIYQIPRKAGDIISVRLEIAEKWSGQGICEFPIKPKVSKK